MQNGAGTAGAAAPSLNNTPLPLHSLSDPFQRYVAEIVTRTVRSLFPAFERADEPMNEAGPAAGAQAQPGAAAGAVAGHGHGLQLQVVPGMGGVPIAAAHQAPAMPAPGAFMPAGQAPVVVAPGLVNGAVGGAPPAGAALAAAPPPLDQVQVAGGPAGASTGPNPYAAAMAALAPPPGVAELVTPLNVAFNNAVTAAVQPGFPAPGTASAPRVGSGLRAHLPALQRWKVADVLTRDVDIFLSDVMVWAVAGKQVPYEALLLHVADDALRLVLRQRIETMVGGPDGSKDWGQVCTLFKQLVGAAIINEKQKYRDRLTNGEITQGSDKVAIYGVRIRTAWNMLPDVPEVLMCNYFIQGLRRKLQAECKRTPEGKAWEKLDDLIQYAMGMEERDGASSSAGPMIGALPSGLNTDPAAPPLPIAAFAPHGRGRGNSRWRGRGGRFGAQRANLHGGGRGRGGGRGGGGRGGNGGRGSGRGGGGGRGTADKSQIKCHNCGGMGHYAGECPSAKKRRFDGPGGGGAMGTA